jgi:tetratricopeptide (TPR) repeat protein
MFDWRKRVQILRAENALRDGRLDEAFSIASEKELREWRGCQVVLEKLVDPLLERAAAHLEEGRLADALADVERAQAAGGNRPRVAELRGKVRGLLEEGRRGEERERALLASARRHLKNGSVGAGKALLEAAEAGDPEIERLKREADRREERAGEACGRAERLLGQGALLEAARAAAEALSSAPGHQGLPDLIQRLKEALSSGLERALAEGSLATAEELQRNLLAVCGESLEARRAVEAIGLCREAAAAVEGRDYQAARAALLRLERLCPKASWVAQCGEAVEKVAEGLQGLRGGPLSGLSAGGTLEATLHEARKDKPRGAAAAPGAIGLSPKRFLLWVDGVGSYLVLRSERVTIGRAGSSARPDLALAADLAGLQAELLRVDDDYFLAAHGPVEVNGRRVDRKLLAAGDRIKLAPRSELVFGLPSRMSTTAVLSLASGQRIEGDVAQVILLDHHLIMGSGEGCHIRARGAAAPILLCVEDQGLVLRSEEGVVMDGEPAGKEALVRAGAQIQVGDLTFTVTPVEG